MSLQALACKCIRIFHCSHYLFAWGFIWNLLCPLFTTGQKWQKNNTSRISPIPLTPRVNLKTPQPPWSQKETSLFPVICNGSLTSSCLQWQLLDWIVVSRSAPQKIWTKTDRLWDQTDWGSKFRLETSLCNIFPFFSCSLPPPFCNKIYVRT